MSEHVKLEASDGHELDAYVAHPEGGPIAGLVVVQEIFGVNRHIRSVADGYAKDGFLAIAPALFDRYERGLELGYEGEDMQKAMSLISRLNLDHALKDTAALQAIKLFGLEVPCQRSGSPFWPRGDAAGLPGLLPHCRPSGRRRGNVTQAGFRWITWARLLTVLVSSATSRNVLVAG